MEGCNCNELGEMASVMWVLVGFVSYGFFRWGCKRARQAEDRR